MQLKDIAIAAGVSQAAVSIVRTGKPGVSVRMRLRIQQLLLENGFTYVEYPPKPTPAPTPKPDPTNQLYLIRFQRSEHPTDGNESFISTIITALEHDSRRRGFQLLQTLAYPDTLAEAVARIAAEPCDGVFLLATELEETDLPKLAALPCPVVLINSDFANAPYSTVTVNNREIAMMAVETLYELGHRRIGFLASALDTTNFSARLQGFREAMARFDLPFDESMLYLLSPLLSGARDDMAALLAERGEPPTALFSVADILAIGAVKALKEAGYRVPEDVSVLSVGNIPFAAVCEPPLSTIAILCEGLSRRAMSVLLHNIRVERAVRTKVMISGELMPRQSIGPARIESTNH